MRRSIRRMAVLGVAALAVGFAALAPGASASASEPSFTVTNSASFDAGPVPRGALLTIFTDVKVSGDSYQPYDPWTYRASGGLQVWASCEGYYDLEPMVINYVGDSLDGTQINFYLPNSTPPEPYGTCDDEGRTRFVVYSAHGYPSLSPRDIVTVPQHPGIFAVGLAPSGNHEDGATLAQTALTECNKQVPSNADACRARTDNRPAKLSLHLTGADQLLCGPPPQPTTCAGKPIFFQLAPVTRDGVGTYVTQNLLSITPMLPNAPGAAEVALIELQPDTPGGEFRIRVVTPLNPDPRQVLVVWLGTPT
jgi:hypothetical protein